MNLLAIYAGCTASAVIPTAKDIWADPIGIFTKPDKGVIKSFSKHSIANYRSWGSKLKGFSCACDDVGCKNGKGERLTCSKVGEMLFAKYPASKAMDLLMQQSKNAEKCEKYFVWSVTRPRQKPCLFCKKISATTKLVPSALF